MAAPQKSGIIEEKLQNRLQSLMQKDKHTTLASETTDVWLKPQLSLIGVPSTMLETCRSILEYTSNLKIIWLHLQECTGCSESLLRTETPSFDTMIFDTFKIVYHDLVMAASGHGAVSALEQASANEPYILLVEGSVPMGFAKEYITLGNRNGYDEVSHILHNAEAVFAVGTCSSFGGIQSAYPNPTNGHALSELFECDIINIPGCPPSDKNIIATLLYYYLFGEAPQLDDLGRPLWAYSKSVHDLCERKSSFMAGEFVESFDDPNMQNGYCLYKVGCKGPYTYNNCPKVKFNAKTSWPVQGGHGCIGCSEPNFWDNFGNIEKPLSNTSFFMLNPKFIPKVIPIIRKTISAPLHSMQEYQQISKELGYATSMLIDCSLSHNQILICSNDDCATLPLSLLELNPKAMLQAYESKNKQGKKLYANYQKAFKNRYESLMQLSDSSRASNDFNDIMSVFMMILDENVALSAAEIASVNAWLEGRGGQSDLPERFVASTILQLAKTFKFPYISTLDFKFKRGETEYSIDYAKALSQAMAYSIGGLDSHGIAYSIVCDSIQAMLDMVADDIEAIFLQGEIFEIPAAQQIFARQFQEKKIVMLVSAS